MKRWSWINNDKYVSKTLNPSTSDTPEAGKQANKERSIAKKKPGMGGVKGQGPNIKYTANHTLITSSLIQSPLPPSPPPSTLPLSLSHSISAPITPFPSLCLSLTDTDVSSPWKQQQQQQPKTQKLDRILGKQILRRKNTRPDWEIRQTVRQRHTNSNGQGNKAVTITCAYGWYRKTFPVPSQPQRHRRPLQKWRQRRFNKSIFACLFFSFRWHPSTQLAKDKSIDCLLIFVLYV